MCRGQKGFTLIEVLVSMAVAGLLLSGVVVAIFQTTGTTMRSTTQITALENIKSAAYAVSKDVRRASTTTLVGGAPAVASLTLDWTVWYDSGGNLITNGEYHRVQYSLSSSKLLRREGTYLPSAPQTPPIPDGSFTWQAWTTAAKYISSIAFSRQVNIIRMTVTSSPENKPEKAQQETYHMFLQAKEDPVR